MFFAARVDIVSLGAEPALVVAFPRGFTESQFSDINQLGGAVGRCEIYDAAQRSVCNFCFVFRSGVISVIPAPPTYKHFECVGISDNGYVVGRMYAPTNKQAQQLQALVFDPQDNSLQSLPQLDGTGNSLATSISADGSLIGGVCSGQPCTWLREKSEWCVTALPIADAQSQQVLLSNSGNFAVAAVTAQSRKKSLVLWLRNGGNWVVTKRIEQSHSPYDVNDLGEVVGSKDALINGHVEFRAFHLRMATEDNAREIPPLSGDNYSVARAINNYGLVVGWSDSVGDDSKAPRAFTWQSGKQAVLAFGEDVLAHQAYAVNDRGDIAGLLERADDVHAVGFVLSAAERAVNESK